MNRKLRCLECEIPKKYSRSVGLCYSITTCIPRNDCLTQSKESQLKVILQLQRGLSDRRKLKGYYYTFPQGLIYFYERSDSAPRFLISFSLNLTFFCILRSMHMNENLHNECAWSVIYITAQKYWCTFWLYTVIIEVWFSNAFFVFQNV